MPPSLRMRLCLLLSTDSYLSGRRSVKRVEMNVIDDAVLQQIPDAFLPPQSAANFGRTDLVLNPFRDCSVKGKGTELAINTVLRDTKIQSK